MHVHVRVRAPPLSLTSRLWLQRETLLRNRRDFNHLAADLRQMELLDPEAYDEVRELSGEFFRLFRQFFLHLHVHTLMTDWPAGSRVLQEWAECSSDVQRYPRRSYPSSYS